MLVSVAVSDAWEWSFSSLFSDEEEELPKNHWRNTPSPGEPGDEDERFWKSTPVDRDEFDPEEKEDWRDGDPQMPPREWARVYIRGSRDRGVTMCLLCRAEPLTRGSRVWYALDGAQRVQRVDLAESRSVASRPVARGVTYEPIAAEMIYLNTPGSTSADVSALEYKYRTRPMFPYERDTQY